MRHGQDYPLQITLIPSTSGSFPSPLPSSSSSRWGSPRKKAQGAPLPLFSPRYTEDLAEPQPQHLWPGLGWGAGKAELRRGEMCGGLPSLPSSSPSPFQLPNWGPGQAALIGWGTGRRLPLSQGQSSSQLSIRMV